MYVVDQEQKNTTQFEQATESLAEASWHAFSKYLSKYQWAFDDPAASPRKTEIAHAIGHRGQKGSCTFQREDGRKYVLRTLAPWAFEQAISRNRKLYYVSYGRAALLYLDVDLHQVFQRQADGQVAVDEINRTRLPIYWIDSTRGFNGFLKVVLAGSDFTEANEVFERLQMALRLVLADQGNLCDFEIKGRCGHLMEDEYSWSQYGKLPIHHPKWSWAELEKFINTPAVTIKALEKLCAFIEAHIPQDVLEKHNEYMRTLRSQPRIENGWFLLTDELEAKLIEAGEWRMAMSCRRCVDESPWIPVSFLACLDQPRQEEIEAPQEAPVPTQPIVVARPTQTAVADLVDEPDSFERQREALLRFSRALKRVPSLKEALDHIRENNLFTGRWTDNAARRKSRIKSILKFIARTFDASKCCKGSVNVGKYVEWAKKKFPNGLSAGKRRWLSPEGETVETENRLHVGPEFIATFVAVSEFMLLTDKNQDDSVPHNRASKIWTSLHNKGLVSEAFHGRKWALCRKRLDRLEIVQITDRNFGPGKAMRWAVGKFFPMLGLWKRKKKPAVCGAVSLAEFLGSSIQSTTREHNTLLYPRHSKIADPEHLMAPRPPP